MTCYHVPRSQNDLPRQLYLPSTHLVRAHEAHRTIGQDRLEPGGLDRGVRDHPAVGQRVAERRYARLGVSRICTIEDAVAHGALDAVRADYNVRLVRAAVGEV